jgi:Organic solute transporter Ostalpha
MTTTSMLLYRAVIAESCPCYESFFRFLHLLRLRPLVRLTHNLNAVFTVMRSTPQHCHFIVPTMFSTVTTASLHSLQSYATPSALMQHQYPCNDTTNTHTHTHYCCMQTEGNFSWKSGYVYVTVVTNFSQTWALYALVKFYRAAAPELAPWRPGICLYTYVYTPYDAVVCHTWRYCVGYLMLCCIWFVCSVCVYVLS